MNKNKTIKKIEITSSVILLASLIAIAVGLIMVSTGIIKLSGSIRNGLTSESRECYVEIIEGIAILIHYFFVSKFFVIAFKERVPLTHENGKELRVLGWESIIIPIVITAVRIFVFMNQKPVGEVIEFEIYEIVLGIFLVEMGFVIDYATDKIEAGHKKHLICNEFEEQYPEAFKAAVDKVERELYGNKD